MKFSFQEQTINDFLAVRKFNTTCWAKGLLTDEELDRKQKETLQKYAGELADGDWMDIQRAEMALLEEEAKDEHADWVQKEYGYMARGEN